MVAFADKLPLLDDVELLTNNPLSLPVPAAILTDKPEPAESVNPFFT